MHAFVGAASSAPSMQAALISSEFGTPQVEPLRGRCQRGPEVGPTSALYSCIIIPTGMHGPACIFWADLTPVSPQLSFSATSADLSSAERFPMFMRLPPSDAFQGQAMADLVRLFAAGREFALLKASHPFYLGALHIKSSRTTCAAAPAGRRSAAQMRAKGE